MAAQNGHIELVRLLLCDKRTNLSENNIDELLKIAILGQNEELILFFILIKSTKKTNS